MRKELIAPNDKYQMNWVEGVTPWGTVKTPKGIEVQITSKEDEGVITESYRFRNVSGKPLFTSLADVGIYTTFNDDNSSSDVCTRTRCHTHIYCGGELSYVMALRMGGEAPHLGLVLTKGSLDGYSVERDLSRSSNDRGDFILHPSPVALNPDEEFEIEWRLFWHNGKEDFYKKLREINPKYVNVDAENYVVFAGENIRVAIDGVEEVNQIAEEFGVKEFYFSRNGINAKCSINVLPKYEELLEKRVNYIVEKQQLQKDGSPLDGAYLIYDTKEKHIYYRPEFDFNAARERVGMGVLIASYLQRFHSEKISKSFDKYLEFVERELYDSVNNIVANDYGYDNHYHRLYNYPWMSLLFLEAYELKKDVCYLRKSYKIMSSYYLQGGEQFYAVVIPIERLLKSLLKEGMTKEHDGLISCFKKHCDVVLEKDISYPPHEVNYEHGTVTAATSLLLEMYLVTRDEKYKIGGKRQLEILELFNGKQPNYLQHEVAIRHWDAYWFGKKRQYGDTYPHYWSALTGNAYMLWYRISGDKNYEYLAEKSLRAVLSMFFPDGSASCAYLFPVTVNGEPGQRFDDYANDQDWGMYFYLQKYLSTNQIKSE